MPDFCLGSGVCAPLAQVLPVLGRVPRAFEARVHLIPRQTPLVLVTKAAFIFQLLLQAFRHGPWTLLLDQSTLQNSCFQGPTALKKRMPFQSPQHFVGDRTYLLKSW